MRHICHATPASMKTVEEYGIYFDSRKSTWAIILDVEGIDIRFCPFCGAMLPPTGTDLQHPLEQLPTFISEND